MAVLAAQWAVEAVRAGVRAPQWAVVAVEWAVVVAGVAVQGAVAGNMPVSHTSVLLCKRLQMF